MPTTREMAKSKVLEAIEDAMPGGTAYPQLRVKCYPMPISDALEMLEKEGLIRFEKDSMRWFRTGSKPAGTIPYKLAYVHDIYGRRQVKVGTIVNATDGTEITGVIVADTVVDKVADCEGCVYLSIDRKRCEYLQKDFPDAWKDIPGRAYECLVQDLKWDGKSRQ